MVKVAPCHVPDCVTGVMALQTAQLCCPHSPVYIFNRTAILYSEGSVFEVLPAFMEFSNLHLF